MLYISAEDLKNYHREICTIIEADNAFSLVQKSKLARIFQAAEQRALWQEMSGCMPDEHQLMLFDTLQGIA